MNNTVYEMEAPRASIMGMAGVRKQGKSSICMCENVKFKPTHVGGMPISDITRREATSIEMPSKREGDSVT